MYYWQMTASGGHNVLFSCCSPPTFPGWTGRCPAPCRRTPTGT